MVSLKACSPGLDFFNSITEKDADLILPDGWTIMHSAMLHSLNPGHLKWVLEKKLIPNYDMSDFIKKPVSMDMSSNLVISDEVRTRLEQLRQSIPSKIAD